MKGIAEIWLIWSGFRGLKSWFYDEPEPQADQNQLDGDFEPPVIRSPFYNN